MAKVYLTDGKNDIPVEVTEQTATSIKFKIPTRPPAAGADGPDRRQGPKLIEQPVKVTIDE